MKVKIDHINNFGNGVTISPKKIFIPYVIEDEEVEAELLLEKKDYSYATLTKIINPSPERVTPPCQYYTKCGGCNLQHMSSKRYSTFKHDQLIEIIKKTGNEATLSEMFILRPGIRHRANFKVQNKKIGFNKQSSHEVITIDECIALTKSLNDSIALVNQIIAKISPDKFKEVELVAAENGIDCLFTTKDQLTLNEKNIILDSIKHSPLIRISYKVNEAIEVIYSKTTPYITINNLSIELPPHCFLQVSKESIDIMLKIISPLASDYKNIIDLFAGIGTYGYALCNDSSITAIESNHSMVKAINENAKKYKLSIKGISRDLHKNPLKRNELRAFDLAIINPPRSGAEKQIANCTTTDIIMVSCNPISFIHDSKLLQKKGYKMGKIYAIDQFYWTNHLELIAFFRAPRLSE